MQIHQVVPLVRSYLILLVLRSTPLVPDHPVSASPEHSPHRGSEMASGGVLGCGHSAEQSETWTPVSIVPQVPGTDL